MGKINYKDIKQFTGYGYYKINVEWYGIKDQIEYYMFNGLDIDPDFQRGHVWSVDQQVEFVEHVLMGGPGGRDLFFNCPGFSNGDRDDFVLVDGKQRITAMIDFLYGKIAAFGHMICDFEGRKDFSRYWFNIHINELPTKADVLRWYIEMNSGGVVHSKEEIERVQKMLEEEKKRT